MIDNKIVALGYYYIPILNIIRSCAAEGNVVYAAYSTDNLEQFKIIESSKYVEDCVRLNRHSDQSALTSLLNLGKSIGNSAILYPSDDYSVAFIDKYYDQLSECFVLMVPNKYKTGDLTTAMDKHMQNALAESLGLNVPNEVLIDISDDIDIPDNINFPCYVKPLSSLEGKKKSQKKCCDRDALLQHLCKQKSISNARKFLIQDFLNMEKELILIGVRTDVSVSIVAVVDKLEYSIFHSGMSFLFRMLPMSNCPDLAEIEDKLVELIKKIEFIGSFDLELNISDNRIYFNELNIRPSGVEYALTKSGINLPMYIVNSYMCEEPIAVPSLEEPTQLFVNEKIAFLDLFHKKRSYKEIKNIVSRADYGLVKDDSDPMPYVYFKKYVRAEYKKKYKKKITKLFSKLHK